MTKDTIKQFEETLRKLLKKKRLTAKDMGMIEVMVFVAMESNLINMPDITYESLNYGREYYFYKATPKQRKEAERYYRLLGELGETIGIRLAHKKALKSFVQERIDSIVWSLCQNEHIEGALMKESILDVKKAMEFSHAHLNSLTDMDSVENYKRNIDNTIDNAVSVLNFLAIYREIVKAIAEVYELPELLLLLDDTIDGKAFARLGSKSKAQIEQYIFKPSREKEKRLHYIFENFCALEKFKDVSDSTKANIKEYIELCSTEPIPKLEPVLLKGIAVFKNEEQANDGQEQQADT